MASIESMESLRTTAGPSAMPANGAVLMRAWVMAHALQHDVRNAVRGSKTMRAALRAAECASVSRGNAPLCTIGRDSV